MPAPAANWRVTLLAERPPDLPQARSTVAHLTRYFSGALMDISDRPTQQAAHRCCVPVSRALRDVVFGGQQLGDLSEAVPLSVQLAGSRC